jgi:thioesterase domain-containing protein/acyl carrier protein
LARQYLNQPELTAKKFKPVPGSKDERIYLTGDLGKMTADGCLTHLGRKDFQVNIRGQQVEIVEIENALAEIPGVKEAIVRGFKNKEDKLYLAAYIVYSRDLTYTQGQFQNRLNSKLPDYMIPVAFIKMSAFPVTTTGKIDRNALPEPDISAISVKTQYKAPRNEVERKMIETWENVLDVKGLGINSNFFELGGQSFTAMRLAAGVYREFNLVMPLEVLFDRKTITGVSEYILQKKYSNLNEDSVILLNKLTSRKLFCFPAIMAYGMYLHFSSFFDDYSIYTFNFFEADNRIEKYADLIIETQEKGPYVLFAYSAGGRLVFEVAKKLEKRGIEVSDVILIDCHMVKEKIADPENGDDDISIEEYVEKKLKSQGMEFLREKVLNKIRKYIDYCKNFKGDGVMNANIHLILSENNSAMSEIIRSWSTATNKTFLTYQGFGKHADMLNGGFIQKNAEIVKKILQEIKWDK